MPEQSLHLDDVITSKAVASISYAGAGSSIGASLTMTDWGILVGIVTALATFALNVWFQWDRRRREIKEHEARLRELNED